VRRGSLPVTPPAISTVYGAIAMSMPGNTKSLNGDTYQRVDEFDPDDVETPNEYTRIDIPEVRYEAEAEFATSTSSIQIRRRKDKEKFPSEKRKTLIALVCSRQISQIRNQ